jgi:hypothetical protein
MSSSTAPPGIPSTSTDLEILRAFEPIVHYTQGEKLFPMDVERYASSCSLWLYYPDDHDEQVVPEGAVTMDALVERREAPFGSLFYLRFMGPLGLQESARALTEQRRLARKQHSEFHAGVGRLARGGLLPRLGDGLFSVSLLLRGKVPGATAAAAVLKYSAMHEENERYVYYGRVVRQGGWTLCQYWFFFAYNNWRSGFHGVNDHESDWEMVTVYLYEDDGRLLPEWVAYASHDFHGADLRRRWDDPVDLELSGSHPVVYAGAGSHASYFRAGEYQAEVPIPVPQRMRGAGEALGRFWYRTLGQGEEAGGNPLRIPFIDFARGDGLAVGPGREKEWTPVVIDDTTPWVARYRGMWGLYAQDPIAGENAPAGPGYNRDGSPRSSWVDPLGFAALDQAPPPPREIEVIEAECGVLEQRQEELDRLLPEETAALQELGTRLQSMQGSPHLAAQHERLQAEVAAQSAKVRALRKEQAENDGELDGLRRRLERRRAGVAGDPRAHIRNAAEPVPASKMRFDRVAEIWAAISISALLLGLAAFVIFAPGDVWAAIVVLVIVFVLGESVLRGSFVRTVNQVAVVLALIASVVLVVHFWKAVLVGLLVGFAGFLVYQRIRELRA